MANNPSGGAQWNEGARAAPVALLGYLVVSGAGYSFATTGTKAGTLVDDGSGNLTPTVGNFAGDGVCAIVNGNAFFYPSP